MQKFLPILLTGGLIIMLGMSSPATRPDEKKFQNLKILPKDITEEALDSVMGHFAVSLGVKCNFCHFRPDSTSRHLDFASDKKEEKGRAREMMKMTAYLNENYFNEDH